MIDIKIEADKVEINKNPDGTFKIKAWYGDTQLVINRALYDLDLEVFDTNYNTTVENYGTVSKITINN